MQTLLLGPDDVDANTPLAAVIDAVEGAFGAYARGDVVMPAKSYVDLPQYNGDFRSMPAYVATDEVGRRRGQVGQRPRRQPRDVRPPHGAGDHHLPDPANAFPLSLMDGTHVTRKAGPAPRPRWRRTTLAVDDARSMGLVGAGVQSYTQLEAISQIRDIEEVVVADQRTEAVQEFVDHFSDRFDVRGGSIEEAAHCDVLSTVTPVEEPIVHSVGERTHVNAIGADAAGKHEIADEILLDAKLVIDDYAQCTHPARSTSPGARASFPTRTCTPNSVTS